MLFAITCKQESYTMKSRLPHRLFPFFLILYELGCNLSNDLYLPAIPEIARQFSTNVGNLGLTIAAWLAGDAAFQWLLGPLSDRFGRRPILFMGGALFSVATLGCAFSQDLSIMIIARFVQGIGVCSMMIAGYSCIHESYSDTGSIKILAWMTSISVIAPMVGPLLGGLLLVWVEWRWLFLAIQLLATIALCGLWFVMPNNTAIDRNALNPQSIIQGYLLLLKNKPFLLRCGTLGLIYSSLIAWITGSPVILMTDFKLSAMNFGLTQIPIFGCYTIASQIGQKLMMHREGTVIIRSGIKLSMLGIMSLFATIMLFPSILWGIVASMSLIALGAGLTCAPLNRACFQSSSLNKGITAAMFYTILMTTGTLASIMVSLSFNFAAHAVLLSSIIGVATTLAWLCDWFVSDSLFAIPCRDC